MAYRDHERAGRRALRLASFIAWAKVTIAYAWTSVLCWAIVRLVLWVTATPANL